MRNAVFLDRDGVLNRTWCDEAGVPHPPATLAELQLEDGVEDACRRLGAAGWLLIAVTNQPGIARGTVRPKDVAAINAHLAAQLGLDDVLMCPHDSSDACLCRKPEPGMLLDAVRRWDVDVASSVMVGDRTTDVEAGRRAGCRTILVDRPYSGASNPDATVVDLRQAAQLILADTRSKETNEPTLA